MKPRAKRSLVAALAYTIGVAFGMYAMAHFTQGIWLSVPGTVCIFVILALINWATGS